MKTQRFGQTPAPFNDRIASPAQQPPIAQGQTSQTGQIGDMPPIGQVGIPNQGGGVAEPLDAATLKKMAGLGGAGIRGTGALTGQIGTAMVQRVDFGIATAEEKPVLITANAGREDQVHFVLDIPKASLEALMGQTAQVSGTIEKTTDRVGAIEGAAIGEISGFAPGTYARLKGTVEDRQLFAIGGEAAPSGNWLVLDAPIRVAGQDYADLYLGHANVRPGEQVDLNGRLDVNSFGGVETPRRNYVELTGVSNPGAGEPLFDGRTFTSSASGKPLEVLSYDRPLMLDAPARIFVLDPGQDKAFLGARGGFIPPHINPFHGFRGQAELRAPTEAERNAVEWVNDQPVDKATGAKLELIAENGMPDGVADGMASNWYLNPRTDTAYRFLEGGFAGFRHHMDQIVKPEVIE